MTCADQPVVREIPYPTEFGITLSARAYTVQDGPNRYSITVVDYSPGQQIHADRAKECKGYPDTCTNRWMNDLRGALDYAVSSYLQRDSKVTYYAFADSDEFARRAVAVLDSASVRDTIAEEITDELVRAAPQLASFRFVLTGVPPGRYPYHAWRPGAETVQGAMEVAAGRAVEVDWP